MSLPTITPAEARRRLGDGSAVLVDIREPMEHAREAIAGTGLQPLSTLDPSSLARMAGKAAVIFYCQSGNRTGANAERLAACGIPQAYILQGGLSGWKAARYPTRLDRSKPIEMQRQVQIGAGILMLTGLFLSWLVSPWFAALSVFVGTGLVFAGISGWCGMAKVLRLMPWNRMSA